MIFGSIIGNVGAPTYLQGYGADVTQGGLVNLISNIVKLIITVGGLFAFFNLIMAGFTYIMHGDKPEDLAKAHSRIYMSLIGLLLMVGSFVLAGIVGWLLFQDASAILNPKVYGPNG